MWLLDSKAQWAHVASKPFCCCLVCQFDFVILYPNGIVSYHAVSYVTLKLCETLTSFSQLFIAIGAEGVVFDSGVGQIGQCRQLLATAATFLWIYFTQALSRWVPPLVTRFGVITRVLRRFNCFVFTLFCRGGVETTPCFNCSR